MKTQRFLCAIWRVVQIEGQSKQRSPRAHHFARSPSLPGERIGAGLRYRCALAMSASASPARMRDHAVRNWALQS